MKIPNTRLAIRHILYVVVCSTFLTIIIAGIQIYSDYVKDLHEINANFAMIETSYVPSVLSARFNLDDHQLALLLQGILLLRDVKYVEVIERKNGIDSTVSSVGTFNVKYTIQREYPLIYRGSNRAIELGILKVYANHESALKRLRDRAMLSFILTALQLFVMSFLILAIVYHLTIRHLIRIANLSKMLNIGSLDRKISLNRRPSETGKGDELDEIVGAINNMTSRIKSGVDAINIANEEQNRLNEELLKKNKELNAEIDKVKGAQTLVRERESQLSNALKMGRMGHWEMDVESKIFTFSDAFYEIYGTDAGREGGDTMSFEEYVKRFVSPDDAELVIKKIRNATNTDASNVNVYLEHRMLYSDGTIGHIAVRFFVAKSNQGKAIKCHGVSQDISERKRMEEELQKTQKLESLGVLAGGIAHDFNNLLAGFFGNIDLALEFVEKGHPASKFMERAIEALGRAKDLTQQLLTFAKGGRPQKVSVQLSSLIKESAALSLSGSKTRYYFEIEEGLWNVQGDPNQLSQVLNNILLNSRQAMTDGGNVVISAQNKTLSDGEVDGLRSGSFVLVEVKDEGPGIPPSLISKVFDPFFTTKSSGSGLGLAMCYSIIRKHDGFIALGTRQNKGTTVSIYLPKADMLSELPGHENRILATMSGRVLVMDDEEFVRYVARDMLRKIGFDVVCTKSGEEAIEVFRQQFLEGKHFDLVMLDITVPGGIGGELAMAEMLKIDPTILGIVASGYADSSILTDPRKHGFAGKIEKPFRIIDLMNAFKAAIQNKGNHTVDGV